MLVEETLTSEPKFPHLKNQNKVCTSKLQLPGARGPVQCLGYREPLTHGYLS